MHFDRQPKVALSISIFIAFASLIGCGGHDATADGEGAPAAPAELPQPTDTPAGPDAPANPATPAPPGDPAPPGETPGKAPAACAAVGGAWQGSVDGQSKITPLDIQPSKASGTASVKLDPGAADTFAIADGSKFTVDVKTLVGSLPTVQSLAGTVKCGKLDATSKGTVGATPVTGTATCTFDDKGCTGEWVTKDATGVVGKGTFKLVR